MHKFWTSNPKVIITTVNYYDVLWPSDAVHHAVSVIRDSH